MSVLPLHPYRQLADVLVDRSLILQDIVKQEASIGHVFHELGLLSGILNRDRSGVPPVRENKDAVPVALFACVRMSAVIVSYEVTQRSGWRPSE